MEKQLPGKKALLAALHTLFQNQILLRSCAGWQVAELTVVLNLADRAHRNLVEPHFVSGSIIAEAMWGMMNGILPDSWSMSRRDAHMIGSAGSLE